MSVDHRYPPTVGQDTDSWLLDSGDRLAALAAVEVVPGVVDPLFDPYTRLVTRLLGVPVSLVSFVTAHQQIFASATGLQEPWASRGATDLELSFCQHVVTDDAPLRVDDAPNHPRVRTNGAIHELGVQAYLGVPLRAPAGQPLGSLCAIDVRPRSWSDDDLAALRDVADAASAAIALRIDQHRQRTDAHDASHRLRTPITGLQLELDDLMSQPGLPADAVLGVRAARDRAEDLALIVEGLVDSVRVRSEDDHEDVDLVRLIASVAERRRLAATGEHVVHDAGRPVVLRTAPGAVRRIVELVVAAVLLDADAVRLRASAADGAGRIEVLGAADRTGPHDPAAEGALGLAHEIAAGIGARISPLSAAAGYELVLPDA